MEKEIKEKKISSKDFITFSFSILALILSILNFYFANLKIENHLQARIVKSDVIEYLPESSKKIIKDTTLKNGIIIYVAFMNIGNRQAIVYTPSYQFEDTTDYTNLSLMWGRKEFESIEAFPITLLPHEMKMVSLILPYNDIFFETDSLQLLTDPKLLDTVEGHTTYSTNSNGGRSADSIGPSHPKKTKYYEVIYDALDSKGRLYTINTGIKVAVSMRINGILHVVNADYINKQPNTVIFSD